MSTMSYNKSISGLSEEIMEKIECESVGDNDGFFEMEVKASPKEQVVMLKSCPFCGNENIQWCCCGPDGCHQITCPNCGNFDFANGVLDGGETLEELRDCMKDKWNTRA